LNRVFIEILKYSWKTLNVYLLKRWMFSFSMSLSKACCVALFRKLWLEYDFAFMLFFRRRFLSSLITITRVNVSMFSIRRKRKALIDWEFIRKRWRRTLMRHVDSLIAVNIIWIFEWSTFVLLLFRRSIAYWSFFAKEISNLIVLILLKMTLF
jgi:hypothetical protein